MRLLVAEDDTKAARFLVQGLDVGGMAEAALQNILTPVELPAERGSILDAALVRRTGALVNHHDGRPARASRSG